MASAVVLIAVLISCYANFCAASFGANLNCSLDIIEHDNTPAVSVHHLKPKDINVIAAMGDSITAGNGAGAWVLAEVFLEYRGLSWAIGGDDQLAKYITLPNIIKQFKSPEDKFVGYSTGIAPRFWESKSRLNVAHPRDHSSDLFDQAVMMVQRMKHPNQKVDFENDWKLINIFIGGNDLCDLVKDWDKYSPDNFIANYRKTLTYLRDNVPRALVSIGQMPDLRYMNQIQNFGFLCNQAHKKECPSFHKEHESDLPRVVEKMREFQTRLIDLLATEFHDCGDKFAVVLQRQTENLLYPKRNDSGKIDGDLTYMAPDCFHYSQKGHAAMARGLWNSLVTPVGKKPTSAQESDFVSNQILCPDPSCPFLATNQNSENCEPHKAARKTV